MRTRDKVADARKLGTFRKGALIALFCAGIFINISSLQSHFEQPESIRIVKNSAMKVSVLMGLGTTASEAFFWFLFSRKSFEMQATAIIFGWFLTVVLVPSF